MEDSTDKVPVGAQEEAVKNEIQEIQDLLQKLKGYETDRPHGMNDETDRAVAEVGRVCSQFREIVDREGIILTLHGSLQYHDPHNLDIDLTMFSAKDSKEQYLALTPPLEEAFDGEKKTVKNWPREEAMTNFDYKGLDELEANAQLLEGDPDTDNLDISMAADFMAELLSSVLIFPHQQALFATFQAEGWRMLQKYPILRAKTKEELESVVTVREERRQELTHISHPSPSGL